MDTYAVGDYIRHKRELKGWTQEDLSSATGISQKTISTWENGRFQSIKNENLEKLSLVFGVKEFEIMMGKDMDGMDEGTKIAINNQIKELNDRINDINNVTITIEEGGIAATDIAVIAATIAYLALGLAVKASYPDAAFMPYFVVIAFIVGTAIYVVGRKWVRNKEKQLKVRKNK